MLSSINSWMGLAGLVYLAAGIVVLRKDLRAARGGHKLIAMGTVFIAVSLAMFSPEHFHDPGFVQNMVPPWMPVHVFWPYFVGCALLAASTSLAARQFVRLSSTMLAVMFSLFVCMIYLPGAFADPKNRFAWAYALRDLSFAGGTWALAGLHSRASAPQQSKAMILFGRSVIAIAAIFYGIEHFLHPQFAPGVPLELMMPHWVPFPALWAYCSGAILLAGGVGLVLGKKSQLAAASIGALMTALTVFLYLNILVRSRGAQEVNEALNYLADTLLYAGAALALASALPRYPESLP